MSGQGPVQTLRRDSGLIEGICEHGVGHPLEASADWMERVTGQTSWRVHGCCPEACCSGVVWQLETLRESVAIANQLILDHKAALAGMNNWAREARTVALEAGVLLP